MLTREYILNEICRAVSTYAPRSIQGGYSVLGEVDRPIVPTLIWTGLIP